MRITGVALTHPLLSNFGFELPSVGGGNYQYNPAGGSWTFAGVGVSGNSSAFTSGNPRAPEGVQVAFLQGGGTYISQSILGFQANTNYTVTFAAAQRGNGNNGGQDFQVYLDNTLLGTFRPGSTNYAGYSTNAVMTTAGAHTLKFLGLDSSGGDNTAFIDNVRITGGGDGGNPSDSALARLDPFNQTGNQLLARDAEWSLPLLSLPGRAGLDLGLGLSYSSLVWTRAGSNIYFDDDNGSPSPGFRLGFATIQGRYVDAQVGSNAYLLITPSGRRVELRQVGASTTYEAGDSSYLQLTESGTRLWLRGTDGTLMRFEKYGIEWRCEAIEDRNGNYLSATYNGLGDLTTITDTLGRILYFNYDNNACLNSITQNWNGVWHTWATFGWSTITLHPSFSGVGVIGASDNEDMPMLTQVGLPDGSHYNFEYTDRGQVNMIRRYTADGGPETSDDVERSHTAYDYGPTADDCPRITAAHVWALGWSDTEFVPHDVMTSFEDLGGGWHRMTAPDGTQYTELYGTSGWQRGLTQASEVWSGSTRQKWTTIGWTQDNTSVSYQTNPRVTETNIYDNGGNRRRTTIDYHASFGLPLAITEYAADGATPLRTTVHYYMTDGAYLDRRIIGLPANDWVFDGNGQLYAKVSYAYDWGGEFMQDLPAAPTQHDPSYDANFVYGRGNLVEVDRWDVTDPDYSGKILHLKYGYNPTGSVIFTRDPLNHQNSVGYTDSFSDAGNRNTFAYPTTISDADGNSSSVQYNYDFGAKTRVQNPLGAVQTITYDGAARVDRVIANTGAYKRYEYYPDALVSWDTVNNVTDEAFTYNALDGAGRAWMTITLHPNSDSGYRAQWTKYDALGRVAKQSKPTEINRGWAPSGDDSAGWYFTQQTYDWKGRPLVTTNPDGWQKYFNYDGCGCAGGERVTVTDEANRARRTTTDVLGRLVKSEELSWPDVNGVRSIYSTANYAYNALDQVTSINHEGQWRTFAYDGYGRLQTRVTPEQGTTTYAYNPDDTIQSVTDARGATATYGYNNRHLTTSINYSAPGGVVTTPNVTFGYDAAGNRTLMTDGLGSVSYAYDQLSQMTSETRSFNGVGTYQLSYNYNLAGELTAMSNPWNWVGYNYDNNGRLNRVNGAGTGAAATYAYDINYRAFGAVKSMTFGDHQSLSTAYDNRMRPTTWNVSNVLGYNYNYFEHTERVNYAQSIYDSTLDRGYQYDQMGALVIARSGAEARAAFGINQQQWGTSDGPYSHLYDYDQQGNMTHRFGWGGEVQGGAPYGGDTNLVYTYSNGKNQRDGFNYDPAGNLTNDVAFSYSYDATGQQASASSSGYSLTQNYDGDGLRAQKYENGATTSYLRSTVLGGAVVAEIDGGGNWSRGYVYAGDGLMAVQEGGQVYWVHEDGVTKSKRITDIYGGVVSTVELDPWGANTSRSSNTAFQPQNFTTYIRDGNGGQDAMARRYSVGGRFSQPDPYGGSYDFSDPQSLNRYAYTRNDPVNFSDPSGLLPCIEMIDPATGQMTCVQGGSWTVTIRVSWADKIIDSRGADHGLDYGLLLPTTIPMRPLIEPRNTGQEFAHAGRPCPPTASALKNSPTVQRQLSTTFAQSGHRTPHPIEQGGWIYQNSRGGLVFRRASADRLSAGGIDLRNPPFVRGAVLVADFHSHPYTEGVANATLSEGGYTGPSGRDDQLNYEGGIPGLVISETGPGRLTIWTDGPNRRGSDPDRARPPAYGYPGNSVDTRARCP